MAKKAKTALVTAEIVNDVKASINMDISKNDIVDMILAEEEGRLEDSLTSKKQELQTLYENLTDILKKEFFPSYKEELELLTKRFGKPSYYNYHAHLTVSFGTKREDLATIEYYSSNQEKIIKKLRDEASKAEEALSEFKKNSKRAKAKIIKDILSATKAGQDVLQALSNGEFKFAALIGDGSK